MRKLGERARNPEPAAVAAAKLIESRGPAALRLLDERAELAAELGHNRAAATWRELAKAAAQLLGAERDSPAVPPRLARRMPRVWLH
jgi:hypothetical protein